MSLRVALLTDNQKQAETICNSIISEIDDVSVDVLQKLPEDKYDIYIVKPDAEVVRSIYQSHDDIFSPYIYVLNGFEMPYHTLKNLVNQGISGLIEHSDIKPVLDIARRIAYTKNKFAKIADKVSTLANLCAV